LQDDYKILLYIKLDSLVFIFIFIHSFNEINMSSIRQLFNNISNKKYGFLLLPSLAFVALVILMNAAGMSDIEPIAGSAKPQLVKVQPVVWHRQYIQKHLAVGRVEANQTADLGFELAGTVIQMLVDEGDSISQGQLIGVLDTQRLEAQMLELSAALKRVQSEAKLAKLTLKRVVELVRGNLESAQRLDESQEALTAANAAVDEVLARQQSLRVELNKSKLIAPFGGTVLSRMVDSGTVINAGQPLYSLQQDHQLRVRFGLASDQAKTLELQQQVSLSAGSLAIQGKVRSVADERRQDTRTVDVIFDLLETAPGVLPGDLLTLKLNTEIAEKGFWVPRTALVSGVRGLWSLFVVQQIHEQTVLVPKLVELLYATEQGAFVRGVLVDDEKVVIDGVQRLVPGQAVQVKDILPAYMEKPNTVPGLANV
jgi:RND family efflux transporter MFP subunit